MQWPGTDWCPTEWDPRFRPWYASAASGPKDVIILQHGGERLVEALRLSLQPVHAPSQLGNQPQPVSAHRELNPAVRGELVELVAHLGGQGGGARVELTVVAKGSVVVVALVLQFLYFF